jgi:hypothetical protein
LRTGRLRAVVFRVFDLTGILIPSLVR